MDQDDVEFEAIPVDAPNPCPEFHSMGDVFHSCARCGWNKEAHDEPR